MSVCCLLFPADPADPTRVDTEFAPEWEAAGSAGFDRYLYRLGLLRAGDIEGALSGCPKARTDQSPALHRGWMLSGMTYGRLHEGVTARGYRLLVEPVAYAEAHYLPLAYRHLQGRTPETVWMEGTDVEQAWHLYRRLGDTSDVLLKDYVKSAKSRWREACFIPRGTERDRFEEIIATFREARGRLFEHGLVFRRYHPLRQIGQDMRGMPVHEEYRLFFWDGELIASSPFPSRDERDARREEGAELASRFVNRFLSIDVARQEDDSWIVVEVGDGGVTGLPVSIDPDDFYQALYSAIERSLRQPAPTGAAG